MAEMSRIESRLEKLERRKPCNTLIFAVVPTTHDEAYWRREIEVLANDEAREFEYLIIPQHSPKIDQPNIGYIGDGDALFRSIAEKGLRVGQGN